MSKSSQRHRLRSLAAHLAADSREEADVATLDPAEIEPDLLEAAAAAMVAGELDPREVPSAIVRELMRPEPGFLGYPDSPTETERLLADVQAVPIDRGGNLPRDLFDTTTGQMTAAGLAELKRRKQAAVDAEDYSTAEYLKQTIAVLGRSDRPLTTEDCVGSSADPQAAADLFFRNGFIILRDCFAPSAVAKMRAAWDIADASERPAWEHARRVSRGIARHSFPSNRVPEGVGVVSRKFYGLSGSLFDLDDAFVDLIDSPKVLPVLKWVLTKGAGLPHLPGEPELTATQGLLPAPVTSPRMEDIAGAREQAAFQANYGTLICTGAGARTYPSDADGTGYTYWHRDESQPDQWPLPKSRVIKSFVYLSDVGPEDGPLAVVPGSHRLQYGPWETYGASFQSSMTLDASMPQERMANHVRFTGKPGDVLLFDTACYHTAMPNRHGKDRRAIIMGWTTSTSSQGQTFSDQQLQRLEASGRMTDTLRAVTGHA